MPETSTWTVHTSSTRIACCVVLLLLLGSFCGSVASAASAHAQIQVNDTTKKGEATLTGTNITLKSPLIEPGIEYFIKISVKLTNSKIKEANYTQWMEAEDGHLTISESTFVHVASGKVSIFNDSGKLFNDSFTREGDSVFWKFGANRSIVILDSGFENEIAEVWWNSSHSIERVSVDTRQADSSITKLQLARELEGNSSELILIFTGDQPPDPVVAQFNESEGIDDSEADETPGGAGLLGLGDPVIIIAGGGVALFFFAALVAAYLFIEPDGVPQSQEDRSPWTDSGAGGASRSDPITVTIQPVDEHTGTPYAGNLELSAQHENSGGTWNDPGRVQHTRNGAARKQKTWSTTGGEVQVPLPPGRWKIMARKNGNHVGGKSIHVRETGQPRETLPIEPHRVDAKVLDAAREKVPLADATVTIQPNIGQKTSGTTGEDGRFSLPVTRAATRATIEIEKEGYESETGTVDLPMKHDTGLLSTSLSPATGSMTVRTMLGDIGLSHVPTRVIPADERMKSLTSERQELTGSDGTVTFNNLPVGQYRIEGKPSLPDVKIDTEAVTITVDRDRTNSVDLPVSVSYSLSQAHLDELETLGERIDGLGSASNRDTAIPEYFGSVIQRVLEVVESIERKPGLLLARGHSPDDAADALLLAANESLSEIEGAMNSTRNVKLFRACSSLEAADERWDEPMSLADYFDHVDSGADTERRRLRDRLQEVDELLDDRWKEVGELGPVRETYERVQELTRSGETQSELVEAALVFVALHILDAVEDMFDREPLLDRLNTTVY